MLDPLLALVVFVSALAYFSLSYDRGFELSDEGLILYHSARTAAGEIPYRDFPDTYGPGVHALTGLVLFASNGSILAVRMLLACFKAIAVAVTFLVCRFAVPRSVGLFGAGIATVFWGRLAWNLNTPYAALYTIPLCLVACYVLVYALRTRSRTAYAIAGLIGGAAILFKQTLGVMNAVGMVMAVCGVAALRSSSAERSRGGTMQFLAVWLVGAVVFVLPAWRFLRPSDYLLHFLPVHLFMGMVATAVLAHGGSPPLLPMLADRLAWLMLGLAVLPVTTAALYAWMGAFDALVHNMITLPSSLVNYYVATPFPPAGRLLLFASIVGLVASGHLALHDRRRTSGRLGIVALLLFGAAVTFQQPDALSMLLRQDGRWPRLSDWPAILWAIPAIVEGALPALVLLGAVTAVGIPLLPNTRGEVSAAVVQTALPLVFLQAALTFQVFPRGSYNVWLLQGATVPLMTLVLHRWYRSGSSNEASASRRLGAALLIAGVPLWFVGPIAHHLLNERNLPSDPIGFPQAREISTSRRHRYISHLGELEQLVAFLNTQPRDARVLPISIDMMMLYVSGRRHAFPELDYYFFLLGLGMLAPSEHPKVADESLVRRLADAPDTLVVIRRGESEWRMLNVLVGLRDALQRDYDVVAEFGGYAVLRRATAEARAAAGDQ